MINSVLFVCLGNICRSPTAEAIFREKVRRRGLSVIADSAGTAGWQLGKAPYEPMQTTAAGIWLRPVTFTCTASRSKRFFKF